MSDSDETVCDEVDDPVTQSQSQMSPSIIATRPREDTSNQKALSESTTTCDTPGSPEFLPPSAKIQRLATKDTETASGQARVCQELEGSRATTATMDKSAGEKLVEIKGQEAKIEELLVLLESNLERGMAFSENSVFTEVKHLMTTVKTQLADFTCYQQQQRQEIAKYSNQAKSTQDGSSSQWTFETKCKLLELAAQQKELLKLLQGHKKLFEKIQALKQKAKSVTKHIIPAVEVHCKSHGARNVQQKFKDKSTLSSPSMTLPASDVNLSSTKTTNNASNLGKQSDKHTSTALTNVSSSYTQNRYMPISSQPLVMSAVSQSPATVIYVSGTTPASVASSIMPQNVVLTGGQLYQVGGKQVYVLPRGLTTSVASPFTVAQAAQLQHVTTATLPSSTTTTASTAKEATVTKERNYLTGGLSVTKSTQSIGLNTATLPPRAVQSWNSRITEMSLQLSSPSTPVPSSVVSSLPISATISPSNTARPVSTVSSLSTSSTLQNTLLPNLCSETGSQVGKQASHASHSTTISQSLNDNTITVSQVQPSARAKSPLDTLSKYTSAVPSSLQATTATSTVSKGPVSSAKNVVQPGRSSSLQRKGSFGTDLPDIKSLLSHNVIETGSNVLSIQHEGRNFEASLKPNGLIESAGGETFRTPMAWMRAVTGSWNTIKQSHAYKMVHYKGKPLALFSIPSKDKDTCESKDKQATNTAQDTARSGELCCNCGQDRTTKKRSGLLTSWDDVAKLLTDCQVMPIGKDELIPTDGFLPANFWESTNEADVPQSVLDELDF